MRNMAAVLTIYHFVYFKPFIFAITFSSIHSSNSPIWRPDNTNLQNDLMIKEEVI